MAPSRPFYNTSCSYIQTFIVDGLNPKLLGVDFKASHHQAPPSFLCQLPHAHPLLCTLPCRPAPEIVRPPLAVSPLSLCACWFLHQGYPSLLHLVKQCSKISHTHGLFRCCVLLKNLSSTLQLPLCSADVMAFITCHIVSSLLVCFPLQTVSPVCSPGFHCWPHFQQFVSMMTWMRVLLVSPCGTRLIISHCSTTLLNSLQGFIFHRMKNLQFPKCPGLYPASHS